MSKIDNVQLDSLAVQLLRDYDAHNPGTAFADDIRLELADAYRLQGAVAKLREHRGEKIIGYKIGCVSERNQRAMGLTHPVWGRLWSTEQYEDKTELSLANFANLAIEAEFAVTINRTIDQIDIGKDTVAQAVEAIFPVLELHNFILRSRAPNGHELIANNAIHAGVVRGSLFMNLEAAIETNLQLIYDGRIIDSWSGIQWPADILSHVSWLASTLASEGKQLSEGDMILTGAWGPPIPVENVRRVVVKSSAFGDVSATFT